MSGVIAAAEQHVLMCDCLDCMGGGPWPGAGKTVPAEQLEHFKTCLARCPSGHLLTTDNRVLRRGKLSGECKRCRAIYQHEFYLQHSGKDRRRKHAWTLPS